MRKPARLFFRRPALRVYCLADQSCSAPGSPCERCEPHVRRGRLLPHHVAVNLITETQLQWLHTARMMNRMGPSQQGTLSRCVACSPDLSSMVKSASSNSSTRRRDGGTSALRPKRSPSRKPILLDRPRPCLLTRGHRPRFANPAANSRSPRRTTDFKRAARASAPIIARPAVSGRTGRCTKRPVHRTRSSTQC